MTACPETLLGLIREKNAEIRRLVAVVQARQEELQLLDSLLEQREDRIARLRAQLSLTGTPDTKQQVRVSPL